MKTRQSTFKQGFVKMALVAFMTGAVVNAGAQCQASFMHSNGANGMVNFSSTSSNGSGPVTNYFWNFHDGQYATGANVSHQFNTPGMHLVTHSIGDSLTCYSIIQDTVIITSVPPCTANVSFYVQKDTTNANPSYLAYPTYPAGVTSVTWSWGDGTTSSGLYPNHTYNATGVYNICVYVSVACGASDTFCLSSNIYRSAESQAVKSVSVVNKTGGATGIKTVESDVNRATIYPNPATNESTIEFYSDKASAYMLDVYSVDGRLISSQLVNKEQGETTIQLDVAAQKPGIYFVTLKNKNESKTFRLIKE